jgi:hypothetical protein
MHRFRAVWAVAIGALACAGSSPAADAQALLDQWRQLRQQCVVIDAQYDVEKEICRAELTAGVARNYWSEEQRQAADDWILSLFAPKTTDREHASADRALHFGTIYQRLREPRPDLVTYTFLSGWLDRRLLALGAFDKTIMGRLASTACDYAEEVWKTAKRPEDLQPAVVVLRETWTLLGMDVLNKIKSASYEGRTFQVKTFYPLEDYYGALGSDHPLFLPPPETDPVAFSKADQDFWALNRSGNGNDFATRASVIEFVRKLDARYRRFREHQQQELDALVQRDAPANDLAKALDQIPEEPPQPDAPKFPSPPTIPRGTPARPDYRQNIAVTPAPWAPRPSASKSPDDARKDKYKLWLKLRRAEESGDSQAADQVEHDLQGYIPYLPASIADALSRRLRPAALPVIAPASVGTNTSAIQEMIRELKAFPNDRGPLHAAANRLANALPQLAVKQSRSPFPNREENGRFWILLAAQPDSAAWFRLRDQAARELLQSFAAHAVPAEGNNNLTALLSEQLEAALEKGNWERAEKLLAIDEAFMIFTPSERTAYLNDVQSLDKASQITGNDARLAAEYKNILISTHSPGLGQFATSQIKRFRPAADNYEAPK